MTKLTPEIRELPEKKLVGMKLIMNFTDFKVAELWQRFMPRRKEILNNISQEIYSLTVYSETHFSDFSPANDFVKWAAVEVDEFTNIPYGMERFVLSSGMYAVFHYKGLSTDNSIFQYIYGEWLPDSGFELDDRPHFEILGTKYKNNDPTSEEEIWIPVKIK